MNNIAAGSENRVHALKRTAFPNPLMPTMPSIHAALMNVTCPDINFNTVKMNSTIIVKGNFSDDIFNPFRPSVHWSINYLH